MIAVRFWIPLLLAQSGYPATWQGGSGTELLIRAKVLIHHGVSAADAEALRQAKTLLDSAGRDHRMVPLVHYYRGYIDYHFAVSVERMQKERAGTYLDSAVRNLEAAIAADKGFAEAYALLASCYGLKTALTPLKGIVWGQRAKSLFGQARRLAPRNPRVAFLEALSVYNTPPLFGGGKEKGLSALKEAARLFEEWQQTDSLQPEWGREIAYAWIGRAHMERREYILAREAFDKALAINPGYLWVRNVLLPALERRVEADRL